MFYVTFVSWLDTELEKRGWNKSELARRSNVSHSAISHVYNEKRKPGVALCEAIAEAMHIPAVEVFRAAGLLSPDINNDALVKRAEQILNSLNPETKKQALTYLEYLLSIEERGGRHAKKNTGPLESNSAV